MRVNIATPNDYRLKLPRFIDDMSTGAGSECDDIMNVAPNVF